MAKLVDDIVSLEKEAESLLAHAHAEAKNIEENVQAELNTFRQALTQEVDKKIEAHREKLEANLGRATVDAEKELNAELHKIDNMGEAALKQQVDRIISRFSEM
jgi:F0F1-type ATP synthase membrane subunit b/b'